ncbi:MAG: hypothetical protein NTU41_12715, partial [Chloroflexi bacterium]|nr:hypothetical protein [Chloroflexota bacterium]
LSEMTDVTLAFSYVRAPRGRRVGLVGIGGGACVQATDDCESVGLRVPAFPAELQGLLKEFTPLTGVGLANPVDTAADVYWDPSAFSKTVRLVADFDGVDMLIVSLPVAYAINSDPGTVGQQLDAVCRVGKSSGKPLLIVLYTGGMLHAEQVASQVQGQCLEAGFPVYRSVRQAAQAMAHLISYCHRATSPED